MQSGRLVSHMTRRVICDPKKSQIRHAQPVACSVLEQLIGIIIAVLIYPAVERNIKSRAAEPKFSIEQVAKILGGVHPTTVLRLLQKRKLGFYQFGNRKMVGQSHLDNYISLAERGPKSKSVH